MGKLIEKEGQFYKECGVVMLATDEASKVCLSTASVTHRLFIPVVNLALSDEALSKYKAAGTIPQHLYITSDDEIKEGDHWINLDDNSINSGELWHLANNAPSCKKIIATTDTELYLGHTPYDSKTKTGGRRWGSLPFPSDKFILAYIEAYNKGEKIDKVLVEYELFDQFGNHIMGDIQRDGDVTKLKLKDNNIIIKKAELTWEEIFEEFKKSPNGKWHKEFYSWVSKRYKVPIKKSR